MRRYLIALLVSIAIISALFGLLGVMLWRMESYLTNGGVIPWWELILFSIARLWGRFWPELSLFIVFGSFGVAHLVHIIQLLQAPTNKATGSS